jgi:hypothetical protein
VSSGPPALLPHDLIVNVAFATCADLPDGFSDDHAAAALLGATYEVWNDPGVDWGRYDRVVVRSVWDYTLRVGEFVGWAARVGAERLRNQPALLEWNSDKTYLADLAGAGIPTVATTFVRPGDPVPLLVGEVVVKPTVSAGGRDTGRFGPDHHDDALALLDLVLASGRTAMVQPYLADVDTAGETAVVVLGGAVSHVLHKKAVLRPDEVAPVDESRGDFAPAEVMFDDDLVTAGHADAAQLALADEVVFELQRRFGPLLYQRIDLVPGPDGTPVVMEIEAVEPCLYLDIVPGAAERFVAAVRAN